MGPEDGREDPGQGGRSEGDDREASPDSANNQVKGGREQPMCRADHFIRMIRSWCRGTRTRPGATILSRMWTDRQCVLADFRNPHKLKVGAIPANFHEN